MTMINEGDGVSVLGSKGLKQRKKVVLEQVVLHLTGPIVSIVLHCFMAVILGSIVITRNAGDTGDGPVVTVVPLAETPVCTLEKFDEPSDDDSSAETPVVEFQRPEFDQNSSAQLIDSIDVTDSLSSIDPNKLTISAHGGKLHIPGIRSEPAGQSAPLMGYNDGVEGDLVGILYDFKRDSKGNDRKWDYIKDVRTMVENNFSYRSVRHIHKVSKILYLSHLFIPTMAADSGPKQFGVENDMKPKGFLIRYTGEIDPPHDGSFRFAGHGDDLLTVLVDGKVVLEANWSMAITGWKPKEFVDKHKCFTGQNVVYGDWLKFKKGKKHTIDLLFGERPGGKISAVLMIQQKNKHYQLAADGRPILPIFALQELSAREKKRLNDYTRWQFAPDTPNFGDNKVVNDEIASLGVSWN